MASANISVQQRALLLHNIQETMDGVIQQLERLERVTEQVYRPSAMQQNSIGDMNHVTVQDNLAALNAKLGCLSGILSSREYQEWRHPCVRLLSDWHRQRAGEFTPVLTQAVLDSLQACFGQYQLKVRHVPLTPIQLQDCAARLYQGCEEFRHREDRVKAHPQDYINGQSRYTTTSDDFQLREEAESLLLHLQTEITKANRAQDAFGREPRGTHISTQVLCSNVLQLLSEFAQNKGTGIPPSFKSSVRQLQNHLQTHPDEREWSITMLYEWYTQLASDQWTVLATVSFSIVSCLGRIPGSFDATHLQALLKSLYSELEGQRIQLIIGVLYQQVNSVLGR